MVHGVVDPGDYTYEPPDPGWDDDDQMPLVPLRSVPAPLRAPTPGGRVYDVLDHQPSISDAWAVTRRALRAAWRRQGILITLMILVGVVVVDVNWAFGNRWVNLAVTGVAGLIIGRRTCG